MSIYVGIIVISLIVIYAVYTRYREYIESQEERIYNEYEYPEEYERSPEYKRIDLSRADYEITRVGSRTDVYRTADGVLHRAVSSGKIRIDVHDRTYESGIYRVTTKDHMNFIGMVTEGNPSVIMEY